MITRCMQRARSVYMYMCNDGARVGRLGLLHVQNSSTCTRARARGHGVFKLAAIVLQCYSYS